MEEMQTLVQGVLVAATYAHAGRFSFHVTIPLEADGGGRCAFEHLWTIETMACLCIAGTFFRDIAGVALVRCDLGLQDLDRAVSWKASRGRALTSDQREITDPNYLERSLFSAREVARDPREPTRAVLDRLFASFLEEGDDIVADVGRGVQ